MRDLYQQLLVNQFEAALCTLKACVDRCPDAMWNAPVGNLAFCQVAFHALFYADLYLGQNEEDVRRQPFHLAHEQTFRDYEELEDRRQQLLYERPFIQSYVEHCREKAAAAIAAETEDSLAATSGFPWLKFSRGELYVYNIRHIQHHAAQLSLRLRLDAEEQVPWFGSGWRG
jgi:DinB superfamily